MRSRFAAFLLLLSLGAWAQAPDGGTPAEPAAPPVAAATPAEAPVAEGCRPLTDKAMAADLKALTAQSQKAEAAMLAQLHNASAELWGKAVDVCDGRAKDRALRNLAEAKKAAAILSEQLGNAPECGAAHKDAALLQDMARSALGERRWADAASLYHKAEDMWDVAVERCTGTQKDLAEKRQAQAETDGYNAEFCAPLFDKARDYTQKLRASAAGISREEKNDGLMVAETLWREAKEQCKGTAAQESARNNAQALARERGTPWVPRAMPAATAGVAAGPSPTPAPAKAASTPAPVPAAAPTPANTKAQAVAALDWDTPKAATTSVPMTSTAATAATAVATTAAAVAKPASAVSPVAASAAPGIGNPLSNLLSAILPASSEPKAEPGKAQAQPESFAVGDMRFKGQFVRDADTPTYSGTGQLSWANGDVFEGTLQHGKRHGKGKFAWANGQRYNGDWVQDVPTGQAAVEFANGNRYEGAVVNSIPEGSGRMVYASGDSYTGQFKAGQPEGNGTYVWKNGQKFEGAWVGGKPNGQGRMLFANGDRFEGTVKDGEPHQTGSFTWANGDSYSGEWKSGVKEGQGTFTWSNGDRWEGTFQNDVQTANGNLIRK